MNAQNSITEHIAATIAAGRMVEEERKQRADEAAALAIAERKRKLAEEWAPHMERLCNALPDWAVAYVVDPEQEYERADYDYDRYVTQYAPISIVVPYLAPIAAYVYRGCIYFDVATPQHDEDGMPCLAQVNFWRNQHNIDSGETDFAIAILRAKDAWDRYTTMIDKWNAAERETEAATPGPAPIPLRQRLPVTDPAEYLVNMLDSMDDMTKLDAAPLWIALMLGMELREMRNTLDDIAAALTEPIVEN